MDITVTEIHRYPLRPPGFEEPLFPTVEYRRTIAEHLLRAPWLRRASELGSSAGTSARALEEPVVLRRAAGEGIVVVRPRAGRCSWKRRRVTGVVARWREVRRWWDDERGVDRLLFRVAVAGGAVVDLALDRSAGWLLVGVTD